jgi:hypothetical protein
VAGGLAAETASAANGDPLLVGATTNSATARTRLATTSGSPVAQPGFQVEALQFDAGVEGSGAYGIAGFGASGGFFSGTDAAVTLDPTATPGPPTGTAFKGDVAIDSNGSLWICIAQGTPGTWIRLSSVNLLQTPQRLIDTRATGGGGPFAANETRTYNVGGVVPGIPTYATGILGILTVVNTVVDALGVGFVVAYPKGTSQPATATNTWYGNNQILANGFSSGLGGSPAGISVFCFRQTDVVIDLTGYVV